MGCDDQQQHRGQQQGRRQRQRRRQQRHMLVGQASCAAMSKLLYWAAQRTCSSHMLNSGPSREEKSRERREAPAAADEGEVSAQVRACAEIATLPPVGADAVCHSRSSDGCCRGPQGCSS